MIKPTFIQICSVHCFINDAAAYRMNALSTSLCRSSEPYRNTGFET